MRNDIEPSLLRVLLRDKVTKSNILWCTKDYEFYGPDFEEHAQMDVKLITGEFSEVICPRTVKSKAVQELRVKKRAEVFTPSWICNIQNNQMDEAWFGRDHVFNIPRGKGWITSAKKVEFRDKNKDWKAYVDAKRLELTCGEAPYLVSRYDTITGDFIPVCDRIGLFDRKMRIVNENCGNDVLWLKWSERALGSIYGYELQGDNVLIARENLLLGFMDYYRERFHEEPGIELLTEMAEVIASNVWQMDGLHFAVSCVDSDSEEKDGHPALFEAGVKGPIRFDAVVGNPPYQLETVRQQSLTNGQARSRSIFPYFQMTADRMSVGATSLIYPGARWIHRSGRGMNQFGLDQINDKHLVRLDFYPNVEDIFKDIDIGDGISIVYKNKSKTGEGFTYVYHRNGEACSVQMDYPGDKLIPLNPQDKTVVDKVDTFVRENGIAYLHDRILSQKLFGIESSFVEDNPSKVRELAEGDVPDYPREIKLFVNHKAGKAGRSRWYVADRRVIKSNRRYIDEWQVVVSSANAGGQKRDNRIEVIDNHSAFGRSRVALGSFQTEEEARNFFNYCRTALIRFMFLMTDESLTTVGKKVPDVLDYSQGSKLIDFTEELNQQLYDLVGLTIDEIAYIENVISTK